MTRVPSLPAAPSRCGRGPSGSKQLGWLINQLGNPSFNFVFAARHDLFRYWSGLLCPRSQMHSFLLIKLMVRSRLALPCVGSTRLSSIASKNYFPISGNELATPRPASIESLLICASCPLFASGMTIEASSPKRWTWMFCVIPAQKMKKQYCGMLIRRSMIRRHRLVQNASRLWSQMH